MRTDPSGYEQFTASMAERIIGEVEGVLPEESSYGKSSRILGASGFRHQIDVFVRGRNDLVLIECKRWTRRIAAESVLAFWGRVEDIRPKYPRLKLHAMIMSYRGFQSGAQTLAGYFRIRMLQGNEDSFGFSYKTKGSLIYTIHDGSGRSDNETAE